MNMCKECVRDGRMTQAEMDQQQAAAREGDLPGFLAATLPSAVRSVHTELPSNEELSARLTAGLVTMAHTLDQIEDWTEAEESMAKDLLYDHSPVELATALATVSIWLARRDET